MLNKQPPEVGVRMLRSQVAPGATAQKGRFSMKQSQSEFACFPQQDGPETVRDQVGTGQAAENAQKARLFWV